MNNYTSYAQTFSARPEVISWIESNLSKHLKDHPENQTEIEKILDYLLSDTSPKTLSAMTYEQAKSNTEKWEKALIKKGEHIKETEKDTEVVHDFKDGFKIVKLVGKNAFEREGYLMSHCVISYFDKNDEIYSLRDKNNMPHCTMSKGSNQVKGKGNGSIHPLYVGYVVKFLEISGMTVGDNEMKNLGYVNVEEVMKNEKDLVFPNLFNKKYFYANDLQKVKNKDRMSLWGLFGLFSFSSEMEVRFNFDIKNCVSFFTETLSKLNKKDNSNKVAMDNSNKVAMDNYNKVAMNNSNEVAMDNSNEVAMDNYNKVAMHNSNEVAMDDHNEVAMHNYNEVAMDNYNEVAMDNYNIACGNRNNEVSFGEKTILVMGNGSKVKGKIGSWFVLFERDNEGEIVIAKLAQIDGKTIKEDTWYELKEGKFVEVSL